MLPFILLTLLLTLGVSACIKGVRESLPGGRDAKTASHIEDTNQAAQPGKSEAALYGVFISNSQSPDFFVITRRIASLEREDSVFRRIAFIPIAENAAQAIKELDAENAIEAISTGKLDKLQSYPTFKGVMEALAPFQAKTFTEGTLLEKASLIVRETLLLEAGLSISIEAFVLKKIIELEKNETFRAQQKFGFSVTQAVGDQLDLTAKAFTNEVSWRQLRSDLRDLKAGLARSNEQIHPAILTLANRLPDELPRRKPEPKAISIFSQLLIQHYLVEKFTSDSCSFP